MNLDAIYESDTSESSIELEKKLPRKPKTTTQTLASDVADEVEEEEEDDDDEEIPVSDLEDLEEEEKEDIVPHTRLTINNTSALLAALERISIPTDKSAPFASHQSIVSATETSESIPDVSDDLQRELAFYSQCLEAVRLGRSRLISEGVPFSRPKDYFAEMVKEDAHMEKIKAKLVEEASAKKAAAEARKLRDLKKFGKQVQVSKLQERQKAKREVLDKIKTLKRSKLRPSISFVYIYIYIYMVVFVMIIIVNWLTSIVSQNAKSIALMWVQKRPTSLMLASTMKSPSIRSALDLLDNSQELVLRTQSVRRRTRNMGLEGKSDMQSQEMPSALVISLGLM